jgi:hypothetical protein
MAQRKYKVEDDAAACRRNARWATVQGLLLVACGALTFAVTVDRFVTPTYSCPASKYHLEATHD